MIKKFAIHFFAAVFCRVLIPGCAPSSGPEAGRSGNFDGFAEKQPAGS